MAGLLLSATVHSLGFTLRPLAMVFFPFITTAQIIIILFLLISERKHGEKHFLHFKTAFIRKKMHLLPPSWTWHPTTALILLKPVRTWARVYPSNTAGGYDC
jgi:hypothetical protein